MEVERGRLTVPESRPKRRWYHLSPDRLIVGLFAVEGFLLLSERFQWFAFNEKKGWTVLIAIAAVCLAVVVMFLWLVVSLLFRWRFQFSLRSLVVLVVAVAVPCSWLTVKMREAERQRRAVEAIRKAGGIVFYDFHFVKEENGYGILEQDPPAPAWLRQVVGNDSFSEAHIIVFHNPEQVGDDVLERIGRLRKLKRLALDDSAVTDVGLKHLTGLTRLWGLELNGTQVTDEGLLALRGLPNLTWLGLNGTQVTDEGLQTLRGLPNLGWLELHDTNVTSQGIKELQEALPNCKINQP